MSDEPRVDNEGSKGVPHEALEIIKTAISLAAPHGSAAKCEWWSGDKKSGFTTCQNAADWQHSKWTSKGERVWKLCDHHKQLLLASYNETWRAKEQPEWTPIMPPNAALCDGEKET